MVKKVAKKTKRKKPSAAPSDKEIRALAKASLGESAMVDFYFGGRIFARNEEDVSIELESTSNAAASRLMKVVLEALGKNRLNAKTGRKP